MRAITILFALAFYAWAWWWMHRDSIRRGRRIMNLIIKTLLSAFAALGFVVWIGSNVPAQTHLAGSTVRLETSGGIGSGVHIGNDFILTAAHVVADESELMLIPDNSVETYRADVLWVNKKLDVALLRSRATNIFSVSPLSCTAPVVGASVTSRGVPLGENFFAARGNVGSGVYSRDGWAAVFLVAGPGASGMSGGPVIDNSGMVIGLTVAGIGRASPFMLAVPSSAICPLLART